MSKSKERSEMIGKLKEYRNSIIIAASKMTNRELLEEAYMADGNDENCCSRSEAAYIFIDNEVYRRELEWRLINTAFISERLTDDVFINSLEIV